jgi:hypothetical protein
MSETPNADLVTLSGFGDQIFVTFPPRIEWGSIATIAIAAKGEPISCTGLAGYSLEHIPVNEWRMTKTVGPLDGATQVCVGLTEPRD